VPSVYAPVRSDKLICERLPIGYTAMRRLIYCLLPAGMLVMPSCSKESKSSCYANLKAIEGAKATLEVEGHRTKGSIVTSNEVMQLLHMWPQCPSGGMYTINPIGTPPTCSVPEHKLH